MKKYLLIIVLSAILFSCSRNNYPSQNELCYNVYKIQLNNEYYEIYARRGGQHFKIISKKEDFTAGEKIRKGKCYQFELTSREELAPTIDGVKILPVNYLDIRYMHGNTAIKIDGGKIHTLHYAKNLKGLYLVE